MSDCDDHFACAVRAVTRRGGSMIWGDPGRLRSRLQYEMGSVSTGQSALLDALVIAAMQGIPHAVLGHDDLEPGLTVLADSVGAQVAADAVDTWMRALARPELVCVELEPMPVEIEAQTQPEIEPHTDAAVAGDDRILTLIERLRPPPAVPTNT